MTSNQIAYHKLQEEERSNKMNEAIKASEAGSKYMSAQAALRSSDAAWKQAIVLELEHYRKSEESTSERAKNWGSAISGFSKGLAGFAGALAGLFA